jgi:hypothetical protein
MKSRFRDRRAFDGRREALRALRRYLKDLPSVRAWRGKPRPRLGFAR